MLPRAEHYLVSRGCDISALHVQITIPYKNWLIKRLNVLKAFILAPGSHTGTLLRLPWGGKWISPCCSRQGAGVLFELKFNRNIFFFKRGNKGCPLCCWKVCGNSGIWRAGALACDFSFLCSCCLAEM